MRLPRDISDVLSFLRRVGRLAGAARAYLAGLGTTGSLLAGAALMFVLASALVAFHGWPHVAAQPSPGEVVVSPRATSSLGSAVSRRLTLITAPGGLAGAATTGAGHGVLVAGGGGPAAAAPASRQSIGTPVSTSRSVAAPATGGRGTASAVTGCVAGGCGPSPAPASAPTPAVPTGPAQAVLQKVGGTLGTVVSSIGSTASSSVQQTTNTAAAPVRSASPTVGGAVTQAGSGTANAIGGATKTISGVLSGLGH